MVGWDREWGSLRNVTLEYWFSSDCFHTFRRFEINMMLRHVGIDIGHHFGCQSHARSDAMVGNTFLDEQIGKPRNVCLAEITS